MQKNFNKHFEDEGKETEMKEIFDILDREQNEYIGYEELKHAFNC